MDRRSQSAPLSIPVWCLRHMFRHFAAAAVAAVDNDDEKTGACGITWLSATAAVQDSLLY